MEGSAIREKGCIRVSIFKEASKEERIKKRGQGCQNRDTEPNGGRDFAKVGV
jgi:hypothetical protein